jgi:hypothetical protein
MSNFPILKENEMLRVLSNSNVVTLNTKLVDVHEFMNCSAFLNSVDSGDLEVKSIFSNNLRRIFCGLELYNGHSMAEIQTDNKKIDDQLDKIRKQFKKK